MEECLPTHVEDHSIRMEDYFFDKAHEDEDDEEKLMMECRMDENYSHGLEVNSETHSYGVNVENENHSLGVILKKSFLEKETLGDI